MTSLHEHTKAAAARLKAAGIPPEEAELDAQLLAARVLGWDRTRLVTSWRDAAPDRFASRFEELVGRRERREPIAQIVGSREFWGLEFEVTREVLTPRPETEGVVEAALAHTRRARAIVDVGTGTGCLAVALAREFPDARIIAVDISDAALRVASRNAARHGVAERIELRQSDQLDAVRGPADLIVSNPPYVPDSAAATLPPEVREFEPAAALFAGAEGLDAIARLVADSPARLAADGLLIFECGAGQDAAIRGMIGSAAGLELIDIHPDLSGIPRTVVARKVD
ncbi:MAG TPA: peptide chain release factor N(5)-glutamine methyltransferase [Vicinamibacterales bacterium]|nr:peptide chain release factor N(5)-glutamine methyltransferase [Vicinamibacterales bacterium]